MGRDADNLFGVRGQHLGPSGGRAVFVFAAAASGFCH